MGGVQALQGRPPLLLTPPHQQRLPLSHQPATQTANVCLGYNKVYAVFKVVKGASLFAQAARAALVVGMQNATHAHKVQNMHQKHTSNRLQDPFQVDLRSAHTHKLQHMRCQHPAAHPLGASSLLHHPHSLLFKVLVV